MLKSTLTVILCIISIGLFAQDPSSIADFESSDQGILIPRTDTSTVNASYATPATGLLIFQNSDMKFYYFDGSKWKELSTPSDETQAFFPPAMTTAQRDALAPIKGGMIYNTDDEQFQGFAPGSEEGIYEQNYQNGDVSISNTMSIAQSFEFPVENGFLTTFRPNVKTVTMAGTFDLTIYSGAGTGGAVLHTQTVVIDAVGPKFIDFTTGINMVLDQVFTIEISTAGSGDIELYTENQDAYPEGDLYENGAANNSDDLTFALFYRPVGWRVMNN